MKLPWWKKCITNGDENDIVWFGPETDMPKLCDNDQCKWCMTDKEAQEWADNEIAKAIIFKIGVI